MKKDDHSVPMKGLHVGWNPHDSMRTLGHEMLPMTGHVSSDRGESIKASDFHIKSSYPGQKMPPSKRHLRGDKAVDMSGLAAAYRRALGN